MQILLFETNDGMNCLSFLYIIVYITMDILQM